MFKTVNAYYEPIDIFQKMGERRSELSDEKLGFICGFIKEKHPQKIVEIGVSAGGTSCVILNCLDKLNMDSEFYSVDISYKCHLDRSKDCGYQIADVAAYWKREKRHKLILGKTIAEVIEEIALNGKIDMLILDTIHYLPGELLDFLVCLPYMSDDAIVVMDDLTFSHRGENTWAIATKVLFDTVTADKYFSPNTYFSDMGAFQIGKDTLKYRTDLFSALMTPWYYTMDEQIEEAYRKIIYMNYTEREQKLFEEALEVNKITLNKRNNRAKEIRKLIDICKSGRKNFIYGAGARGMALKSFLQDRGGIEGFIISDDRSKAEFLNLNVPIFHLGEVMQYANDCNIIVAAGDGDVKKNLEKYSLNYVDTPNWIYPFIKDYVAVLLG